MKKGFKKLLCTALSMAMIAGSIVLPNAASAETTPIFEGDTVEQEWKFDFGAAGSTPEEGFTLVTPDKNYETDKDYGFLGISEESHKFGDRADGFGNQEGQIIELEASEDGIGSVGEDSFGNAGDIYYPTRFALAAEDESYYRVRATVTTLDPSQDAEVSLYTERKHPIFTDETITAGTTKTVEFSVRPTPIYYEKTKPAGAIADNMVNIAVVGDNSALASVEIQKVQEYPVFWVLGDSTVTDGNCSLPFFRLQNFTGVGTGLTKYLPRDMAMVNEGEGGLNANDNYHFNMVKDRIKAGDYLYVEYGHNHKDDGPTGYEAALDKYYDLCHSTGAKLIIVSPIERINTFSDGAYQHTLRDFATTGEAYVNEKVAGGATDIAYVDLNQYSLDFYNKLVTDNGGSADAVKYYFQTYKGGGTDQTHPNDAGAENLAYEFIKAAQAVTDETQKAVLDGFLADITDETPNLVPEEITSSPLGGDAWPTYIVYNLPTYPVVIDDVVFGEDGTVSNVSVTVRDAQTDMTAYGIIVITITGADGQEKGKIYAVDQVDNSTGNGTQVISNFRGDVTLSEGDTYSAVVMQALDSPDGLIVDEEANVAYSSVYKPTDIETIILTNENKDGGEDFNFYGAEYDGTSSLDGYNNWTGRGSAGRDLTLGESGDAKYANIITDGVKDGAANQGSFYVSKDFDASMGSTGRYMIDADLKYISGSGLNFTFVIGNTDKAPWGTETLNAFTVGSNGTITIAGEEAGQISATAFTNVRYILDMDLGTATISIDGDETTVDVANYQTTDLEVSPKELTGFMFDANKTAVGIQVSNLTVAKLKDQTLPEYTLNVESNGIGGNVSAYLAEEDAGENSDVEQTSAETTIKYENGNAVITSTVAQETVLIEAVYNGSELASVKTTPVSLNGTDAVTVPASAGSKLMLWNSLEKMEPIAVVEKAGISTDSLTAEINTHVTVDAQANDGYVFVGWTNEDGTTVSTDAVYTFRLRDNTTLTAQFAEQGGVEDVTSFVVTADKTKMSTGTDQTVTLTLSDVVDAEGNEVEYNSDTDVAWSCSDDQITVEKGIVTIPASYTGESYKNIVPVTCTINNIEKTVNLTLYSSDYYEDFSAVTDFSEWISNSGTTTSAFEVLNTAESNDFAGMKAEGNGSVMVIGSGANGAGKMLAYDRDLGLSDYTTLKFGFDIEPYQIRTDGKDASVTLQFVDSDETKVFDVLVNTAGKNSSFNGTEVAGFTQGTVVSVDTEFDFSAKTMKYTLTNSAGTVLATGTADITANNLAKMSYSGDWQYGKFAIDNVYADYE